MQRVVFNVHTLLSVHDMYISFKFRKTSNDGQIGRLKSVQFDGILRQILNFCFTSTRTNLFLNILIKQTSKPVRFIIRYSEVCFFTQTKRFSLKYVIVNYLL